MSIDTELQAGRKVMQSQAKSLGMPYEDFVEKVAGQGGGLAPAGPTLAEYFDIWSEALNLTRRTRRTFINAVRPLTTGMLLETRTRPPGCDEVKVVPFDDDKVARWLRVAAELNARHDLQVEVPDLDSCLRSVHGSAVVWAGIGEMPLRDITVTDLAVPLRWYRLRAMTNGRTKLNEVRSDGAGAVDGLLDALSNLFRTAGAAGVVPVGINPTSTIKRSRERGSDGSRSEHTIEHRRVLTTDELGKVRRLWCHAGNDPLLDTWLWEYFWHTGSRRQGALNLRLHLIDVEKQLIYPPDKGSAASRGVRRGKGAMPVPRALVDGLVAFARARGAIDQDDLVFRSKQGTPITARRFDAIKRRCAKLDFVAQMDRFGPHHLRSTAAAQVQQHALGGRGPAVMQRYLRHAPNGQTEVYGRASLSELARAMEAWTGHDHPIASDYTQE